MLSLPVNIITSKDKNLIIKIEKKFKAVWAYERNSTSSATINQTKKSRAKVNVANKILRFKLSFLFIVRVQFINGIFNVHEKDKNTFIIAQTLSGRNVLKWRRLLSKYYGLYV